MNLRNAVNRTIAYTDPRTWKRYTLTDKPAVLFIRPRGLHLAEAHVLVDGEPLSGLILASLRRGAAGASPPR